MALPERPLGGLAHSGECRHQDVVERGAFGELFLEFIGPRAKRLIRQLHKFGF